MTERDWASLDRGLLLDVFLRLTASDVDAINFRRVCPGWRVAAGAGNHVSRPWFILNPADDNGPGHVFVRPVDRRRHTHVRSVRVDSTAVTGVYVRGTSRGWLAVNQGERLLLRDPISRAEIPLPAFAGYQLFDVFLSDDPLTAPGSWTAFAFFEWDDDVCTQNPGPEEVLAFCRPGDVEWARVDPVDHGQAQVGQQTRLYRGLEFFGRRPYVLLAKPTRLAVCDVEARRLVVSSVQIYLPPGWKWDWQECLVECGGDLLVVQVTRRGEDWWPCPSYCPGSDYFVKHRIQYFAKAFKIEFDVDGGGMPVASVAVASTGDYAVFVAPQGHAFALPASGFPAVRAGCVYFFAANHTKSVQGMVVIDLQADLSRRDKFVRKLPLAGNWHILSWFCPRPVLDTTTTPARRRRGAMQAVRNAFPFFN